MRLLFILLAIGTLFLSGCTFKGLGPSWTNNSNLSTCACTSYAPVCGTDGKTYPCAQIAQCLNMPILYQGVCNTNIQNTCNNSHDGKDLFTKGNTNDSTGQYYDSCNNDNSVNKYYCNNSVAVMEKIKCPENYQCQDGTCIKSAVGCSDSHKNLDYSTQGTVTVNGVSYTDVCTGISQVKEFYCRNNNVDSVIYPCPEGDRCNNGACVPLKQTCSANNGASNVYAQGTVTITNDLYVTSSTDYCINSQTVKKYYCNGDQLAEVNVDCPNNYECSNGACSGNSCYSSNQGQDIYVKGTTTKGQAHSTDYCTGVASGIKYYCSSDEITSTSFSCPQGYSCNDGRCSQDVIACSDSDGVDSIYTGGTTTKGSSSNTDYCTDNKNGIDYYCDGSSNIGSRSFNCPTGYQCFGSPGACNPSCEHSSQGGDIYSQGSVTYGQSTYTDYCNADNGNLVKYNCNLDTRQVISNSNPCPQGYMCDKGACVAVIG